MSETAEKSQGEFASDLAPSTVATRVLAVVEAVARELRSGRPASEVGPDTLLDRDLGFDSLARVELASRLEAAFRVALPDGTVAGAERPADLVAAVLAAAPATLFPVAGASAAAPFFEAPETPAAAAPGSAETLAAVLAWHARQHGERVHLRLYEDEGDGEALTYAALYEEARAVAAGLQAGGVVPGETVALMLPTGRAYFAAFYGVLLAGAVAVPIYPPARAKQLEEHLARQAGILDNAQASALLAPEEAEPLARALHARVPSLRTITTPERLSAAAGRFEPPPADPRAVALLQYTSGSTGAPKGVTLTHANLLANIRAMATALAVTPEDVFVSWLPLYHDMGLIGAWLGALHQAVPLTVMSPLAFLARPARWLRALHRTRGTLSGGPNFAYELLLRHVGDDELRALDLSAWRIAFNGAEPVSAATLERFAQRFAAAGFRRESVMPVYGLAENCVGLAFPPLGRGPLTGRIGRAALARDGRAVAADAADATAIEVVACGGPLPGHEIRVVDPAGLDLPEHREGRLQFRGPSATQGYWRNPEATARLFDGDWRETGDLGYLAGGEVYVTGRAKDLIIRAGRNIHPADLEQALGGVEGVLPGRVAAFGCPDERAGTERLIVVAETRRPDAATFERVRSGIDERITGLLGAPADEVVLVPPNAIPRTSSGKVRRADTRARWTQGTLGRPARFAGLETLALAAQATWGRLRRSSHALGRLAFAAWAGTVLAALALPVWLAILALPRLAWRWRVLHGAARLALRATGTPLRVEGLARLPATPGVLVANHASYLDVLALAAALPRPVAFVAKAELQEKWVLRLPLRRLGTCFVERFDRARGLQDYRRIADAARDGRSPLFFPEGTFRRLPGLMAFRMGAFVCAVEAGLPVVPVAITGTRAILRSGSALPRPGVIAVNVGSPVAAPTGAADGAADGRQNGWSAAVELRDRVRGILLEMTEEPDARDADTLDQLAKHRAAEEAGP